MRHLWGTTLPTARKHKERGPGRIRGSSARQRPHEGYPTRLPKVACNSMLEQSTNLKKPQNSNNLISKPEISSGELHATFVGNHVVDGTQTQRTRPGPGSGACVAGPKTPETRDRAHKTGPADPPAPPRVAKRSGAHGTLISGHQVDTTLVALIPAEGSLEESNDESQDLFLAVLTSTDRHHVCVVMLTS